jgi:hypothetical protein
MTVVNANVRGTNLSRLVRAMAGSKNLTEAIQVAAQWKDAPAVRLTLEEIQKTTVPAGSLAAGNWASAIGAFGIHSELIEVVRGFSVLERISPLLWHVPFRAYINKELTSGSASWVSESAMKPLTAIAYTTPLYLEDFKQVITVVLTDELVKMSNPSAEACVRRSIGATLAEFSDQQFLNPTVAAVANTNCASITSGSTNVPSTGVTQANISADLASMLAALGSWREPRFIMRPQTAAYVAGTLGVLAPNLKATADGGSLCGIPVLCSTNMFAGIVLLDLADVMYAATDIELGLARQTSIAMDDGGSPATATVVSLWQANMAAIRAERYVSYARAHDTSVCYMTTAY